MSLSGSRRDISALPRLNGHVLAQLRARGIHTVDDVLTLTSEELLAIRGIGPALARRMALVARAYQENRPIRWGIVPVECHTPGIAFDIETDGLSMIPWSIGWRIMGGREGVVIVSPNDRLTGELALPNGMIVTVVESYHATWEYLAALAGEVAGYIYHWSPYDASALKATGPDGAKTRLVGRLHNLLPTYERTLALPLRTSSLKHVAHALGFSWPPDTDAPGAWAVAYNNYRMWCRTGDLEALQRACVYQRADVDALMHVWAYLVRAE